jgi:CPA2 family monovalent cation:H+ antiporter-2
VIDQRHSNPFASGNLIEHAHAVNPKLEIIASTHSDAEVDYLKKFGANLVIMCEREIARGISRHILSRIDAPTGPVAAQCNQLCEHKLRRGCKNSVTT